MRAGQRPTESTHCVSIRNQNLGACRRIGDSQFVYSARAINRSIAAKIPDSGFHTNVGARKTVPAPTTDEETPTSVPAASRLEIDCVFWCCGVRDPGVPQQRWASLEEDAQSPREG